MNKITHNQTVRMLQLINHLVMLVGLWYVIETNTYGYLILSFFVFLFTGLIGINVCYHRLLSHKSYQTNLIIEKIMSLIGVITTMGSPIAWVAIHRQHHSATDTEKDPHSPKYKGFFKVWFGFWNNIEIESKLVRDITKNKYQKFLHRNYLKIIFIYCIVLGLINPWYIIFVYCIPAVMVFHASNGVTVLCHVIGYKRYDTKDEARNSWIGNIISFGEGWHNNHHAKPNNWKSGETWWEIDPPSWIINLIKK
jgi:stearoyl-CoA desaturase (delta-9 desaturase)